MFSMKFLMELLVRTFIETFYLTGTIILIGFLLGMLRNYSIKNLQRSFGRKALMITGFIGVPVHELSHAIIAILFGHKVFKIKLLQMPDENGTMGYVRHSYNELSIYQQIGNFFIGIAPIFGGITSIVFLMHFTLPNAYNNFINILISNFHFTTLNKVIIEGILNSYGGMIRIIFSLKNFQNPSFYIFLFVAISISSHISLSYADIKGASIGLIFIFMFIFLVNIIGLSKYILALNIIKYNILLTSFLILSVILSITTFLVSLVLLVIRKKIIL